MYDELELVNHILQTLGESTTPTLETQHPAVIQARQLLQGYNKEFQNRGWWFNREFSLKLLPDVNGRIAVPQDTLTFRVTAVPACTYGREGERFVKRGKFVYDSVEHTNEIGRAIFVDITRLLDIEDLPPAAASYLKHFAAENAFLDDDGDIQVHARLVRRTQQAWGDLQREEMKACGVSALKTPFAKALLSYPKVGRYGSNPASIGG